MYIQDKSSKWVRRVESGDHSTGRFSVKVFLDVEIVKQKVKEDISTPMTFDVQIEDLNGYEYSEKRQWDELEYSERDDRVVVVTTIDSFRQHPYKNCGSLYHEPQCPYCNGHYRSDASCKCTDWGISRNGEEVKIYVGKQ